MLHEFGHIYYWELYRKNNISRQAQALNQIIKPQIHLGFEKEEFLELSKQGLSPSKLFSFFEMAADKFAISHFYPIWLKLKE
jgi:hypothetical protein